MSYVSETLRREVVARAVKCCEYCHLPQLHALKPHEVDHIRAEKHGGLTTSENLCLSCFDCNRHKGSDLSSVDPITDEVITLFHPRRDVWSEHFALSVDGLIKPLSAKGRVTIWLLNFNKPKRVSQRERLIRLDVMKAEPPESL